MSDVEIPKAEVHNKPLTWPLKRAWDGAKDGMLQLLLLAAVTLSFVVFGLLVSNDHKRQARTTYPAEGMPCLRRVELAPPSASVLPPDRVRVVWMCFSGSGMIFGE